MLSVGSLDESKSMAFTTKPFGRSALVVWMGFFMKFIMVRYFESSAQAGSMNRDMVSPNHRRVNTPPLCFLWMRLSTFIPLLNSYLRCSTSYFSSVMCLARSFLSEDILFFTKESHLSNVMFDVPI